MNQFANFVSTVKPYFLDSKHSYTYKQFEQNDLIERFLSSVTKKNNNNNNNNSSSRTIGGLCFALCLQWAKDMDNFFDKCNKDSFIRECIQLQHGEYSDHFRIRLLFKQNGFSHMQYSPAIHISRITEEDCKLFNFLKNRDCIKEDRFLLLFLDDSVNDKNTGHVISLARRRDKICLFDPNLGIVSFSFTYEQQRNCATRDFIELILDYCVDQKFDRVSMIEIATGRDTRITKSIHRVVVVDV
jgi:hypothetical protein